MANKNGQTTDQTRKQLVTMCKALSNHELLWIYTHLTMELLERDMLPPEYGAIVAASFDHFLTNDISKN